MSERSISDHIESVDSVLERPGASREDIERLVDFLNRNRSAIDASAPYVSIELASERRLNELLRVIENNSLLSPESKAMICERIYADYKERCTDDAMYLGDINRWIEEHPNQIGVETTGTAHMATGIVNDDGSPAVCVLDGWMLPRSSIVKVRLLDEA